MRLETILLIAGVILVSGCADTSGTQRAGSEQQEIEGPPEYTHSEAMDADLMRKDIRQLDFYSEVEHYQIYRQGFAEYINLDDYTGTRDYKEGFILYDRQQKVPAWSEPEVPVMVETGVYHFETPGDAIYRMDRIVETTRENPSSTLVSDEGTTYDRVIKVESDTGRKITAAYRRDGNVVLVAATTNFKRFTEDETQQLLDSMERRLVQSNS